jgi:hypothetical protein
MKSSLCKIKTCLNVKRHAEYWRRVSDMTALEAVPDFKAKSLEPGIISQGRKSYRGLKFDSNRLGYLVVCQCIFMYLSWMYNKQ